MREMKDSGVEWIGEIPKEWNTNKCKYAVNFINGYAFASNELIADYIYPVIRIGDISDGKVLYNKCLGVVNNNGLECYKIRKNDILIAMSGATVGKIGIAIDNDDAYINQRVGIIRTNLAKYLYYILSTPEFIDYIMLVSNGSAQPNVSGDVINEFSIPFPKKNIQNDIVNFLDQKCSEIDSLTADIQTQIETLEEYKKSVITEAVTKGLNPDVEMKDSGIEWIGEIPSTWNKTRIGYSAWLRARLGWKGLKADEYVEEGYLFLSAFNIQDNMLRWENSNCITQQRYDESPEIKLKVGDIILVKDGAGIGKCARIDDLPMGESTTNGSLAVISVGEDVEYRYLYFYLLSSVFQNYIARIMNGMGVPHLSQEELRKIVIPLPSKNEQLDIANYLDCRCKEIQNAINEKKEQLETLAEYKKSLIYEYVTGKKEVPVS